MVMSHVLMDFPLTEKHDHGAESQQPSMHQCLTPLQRQKRGPTLIFFA